MNHFALIKITSIALLVFVIGCAGKEMTKSSAEPTKRYSIDLDDTNYEREIKSGVSVIDFWSPDCRYCGPMGENIELVAEMLEGKVKFFKINVDVAPQAARKFSISPLPTLWVVVDGKPVRRQEGLISPERILALLQEYIEEE